MVIPFDYAPPLTLLPVVRMKINGGEPMDFLLDTGSDVGVLIYPWAAEKAGMKKTGRTKTETVDGSKMDIVEGGELSFVMAADSPPFTVALQNALMRDVPSFLKEFPGRRIAGILGAELIFALNSRLDFDRKQWSVFFPTDLEGRSLGTRVPFEQPVKGAPISFVARTPGGDAIPFLVDTGANGTTIPGDAQNAWKGATPGAERVRSVTTYGSTSQATLLLPEFSLGPLTVPNVDVTVSAKTRKENQRSATLGLDVIARYNVTFDVANKAAYLAPRKDYRPVLPGRFVLGLERKGDRYAVAHIDKDAFKGGAAPDLAAGDVLLTVDGREVSSLPEWVVQLLLRGEGGTTAELTVVPEGQPESARKVVRFRRPDRYKPSDTARAKP